MMLSSGVRIRNGGLGVMWIRVEGLPVTRSRSMRRWATITLSVALVLGGCAPGEPASTTDSPPLTEVLPETTTTEPPVETTATTEASTTSTTVTTTSAATTTITAPLTSDPNLPPAMSRSEVPWAQVGAGWYVVLYDPSKADPVDASDVREGPIVLYLVDSNANRYEITAWAPGNGPYSLLDATPAFALVAGQGASVDETVYEHVDLATGIATAVHTVGFPEYTYGSGPTISLTRPSGANVVVYRSDGTNEWLERRSPSGALLANVFQQSYTDASHSLAWMYGYAGTSLLVTHHGGIREVTNAGALISDVWVPMDTRCEPMRWWAADTFVASCYGQGPATAPDDGYGNPHTYYARVWLLKTDGTAGAPMTSLPPTADVVDFGYHDMWPIGIDVLLKWSGDCGASHVARLQPDGTGVPIPVSVPPTIVADGVELIDSVGGLMTLHAWQGCDMGIGTLFATDIDGAFMYELVPVVGDGRAVIGVVGLATAYP